MNPIEEKHCELISSDPIGESLSERHATITKETAVGFAEWLSENEWEKKEKTHPKHVGKYWSHVICEYETIDELYDIYVESLKQTT